MLLATTTNNKNLSVEPDSLLLRTLLGTKQVALSYATLSLGKEYRIIDFRTTHYSFKNSVSPVASSVAC